MTPEEIERTIQFILQNHADSAVRAQIIEENIRALAVENYYLGEQVRHQGEQIRNQGEQVRHQGEQVRDLAEQVRDQGEQVLDLVDTSRYLVNTTEELVQSNRTLKDLLSMVVPLVAANAKRIERLEERG